MLSPSPTEVSIRCAGARGSLASQLVPALGWDMANACSEWGWQVTAWGWGQRLESCSPASPSTGCTGARRAVGGNTPSGHTPGVRTWRGNSASQTLHWQEPASTVPGRGWGPCWAPRNPCGEGREKAVQRNRQRPGQCTTQGRRLGLPPSNKHKAGRGQTSPRLWADVCHLPSPTCMGHLSPTFLQLCLTVQAASPPAVGSSFPVPLSRVVPHASLSPV